MNKLVNRSFEKLRFLHTSSIRKNCDDTGPLIKKKRRFFDLKLFRQHLRRQKSEEIENEKRELLKMCAKDPPMNWDVRTFLERIEIGDNIDEIEKCFKSWKEFITITPKELFLIDCLTNEQRRKLWKYINKYNYGLYPEDSYDDFVKNFQAPPLENENKPWTQEDDKKLDYYINYYDVNFGDPWLYISWYMKRTFDQVQNKYIELYLKKQNKKRKCELCLTKSTTPLLMNRKFKLDPPFLFIVPSSENFPTMNIFDYYQKECHTTNKQYDYTHQEKKKKNFKNDPLYPSYGSLIFSNKFLPFVNKSCF
ncbi:hypothetical protein PGSY75_1309800 [Plasmodium gaboni]|uniref:Myb-like domain-containing protein n=1 Tax=Plasmodium gaboni TaxID=647221 RepID=A0A151LD83_9APIC|nr:hypothetical protein PGSY75_1309800 [Plasmodium gaboni]KYN96899.1 hypothetical protein PGSY75_1309800 [Plasmodium gaboni]